MLVNFFFDFLKGGTRLTFFIVFFVILVSVYINIYLYSQSVKRKIPLSLIFISALNISFGMQSLVAIFLIKDTFAFVYMFFVRGFMFFVGVFTLYVGTRLLKFSNLARLAVLWFLTFFAIVDIVITLASPYSEYVFALLGSYCVLFTVYYSGLRHKYFVKEEQGLFLKDNIVRKKKPKDIFGFFKDER